MLMRWLVSRWGLGVMVGLSVMAVACSSSTPDDGGDSLTVDLGSRDAASSGVLVTETTVGAPEDGGPWLGAATVPVPDLLAGLLGLSAGERVTWVTPGGPADGVLIIGDTITSIDGVSINSDNDLATALKTFNEGGSVTLTVLRGSETLDLPVTLGTKLVHAAEGSLARVQDLFDSVVSGEFVFRDTAGGEHTAAFASGALSGVNDGRVTITRDGGGPETVDMSPNVFVWIDGSPGTATDLLNHIGLPARVISLDDAPLAVLVGRVIPPALEALEGFLGTDGDGLLGTLGALEQLEELFGIPGTLAGDSGL